MVCRPRGQRNDGEIGLRNMLPEVLPWRHRRRPPGRSNTPNVARAFSAAVQMANRIYAVIRLTAGVAGSPNIPALITSSCAAQRRIGTGQPSKWSKSSGISPTACIEVYRWVYVQLYAGPFERPKRSGSALDR